MSLFRVISARILWCHAFVVPCSGRANILPLKNCHKNCSCGPDVITCTFFKTLNESFAICWLSEEFKVNFMVKIFLVHIDFEENFSLLLIYSLCLSWGLMCHMERRLSFSYSLSKGSTKIFLN